MSVVGSQSKILEDRPDVTVKLVPEGSMVTMDFSRSRVRVFVTKEGKVGRQAPKVVVIYVAICLKLLKFCSQIG